MFTLFVLALITIGVVAAVLIGITDFWVCAVELLFA